MIENKKFTLFFNTTYNITSDIKNNVMFIIIVVEYHKLTDSTIFFSNVLLFFQFQRFKETLKHNVTTTSMALDSAIETIKANVYWMETNYKQVDHWLYMQKGHYTKF